MFSIKKTILRRLVRSLSSEHRKAVAKKREEQIHLVAPDTLSPETGAALHDIGLQDSGTTGAPPIKVQVVTSQNQPLGATAHRFAIAEDGEIDGTRSPSEKKELAKYYNALVVILRKFNLRLIKGKQMQLPVNAMNWGPQHPANMMNWVMQPPAALASPAIADLESDKKISDKDSVLEMKKISQAEATARNVHLQYPVTPSNPKKGEHVFAWSEIKWNPAVDAVMYTVSEPEIDETDRVQISRIKQIIEEKLDIPFDSVQTASAIAYLKKSLDEIVKQFGMSVSDKKRAIYEYYILRDFIGLGKLQPLMNDPNLEDISCDGLNIPIYIYHRNPLVGSVRTNIVFTSKEDLDDFVMRLAQKCGKSISVSEPLSEGALPDGSRVQATLGTDIARRGSNFTIRKFTTDPLTPMHLISSGTMNEEMLAYFWYAIENNASILISGPTASGKTSLLNALSLFIKPSLKVVTIEDTPELKLPHSHWVPEVSRTGFGTSGGKMVGEVTMFDLLKGSLRQRPDYIIVGEVRGEEAYVLFQQMASGHSGLSTIHADSVEKVLDRLTTPPINLPAMLLETLDLIIFAKHIRYGGRYVRRVMEVQEIKKYNTKEKGLETLCSFKWFPASDTFATVEDSRLMKKIAANTGIIEATMKLELKNRMKVISWMKEKKITNFREVGKIIAAYYSNPAGLLDTIESEV